MQEKSLSYKTLKNVAFSFMGYTLPILFSVFITPIVVHKLGTTDYGVYVLINTIIGMLVLLDLGLGTAMLKYAAEYHTQRDFKTLKELLDSGNLIFLLFGLFGLLVFLVVGKFFLPAFHVSVQSQSHILIVFALAGILFFFNSISTFYNSLAKALQRFDINVTLSLVQLTVLNFSMLGLVLLGYELKAILLANIVTTVCMVIGQIIYCRRLLPEIKLGYGWSWEQIRKGYKFGIAAFVTNLSGSALVQLDKLIIPMFLGPAALTFYALPGNVPQKINGITGASTGIFFPMLSSLSAAEEKEKIKNIYLKLFRNITIITAGMAVPIAFFARKILQYWLGPDFATQGTVVLIILSATYFILGIYGPLIHFLLGLGRVRFLMKSSLFMAVLNLLLLILWVPKSGIVGAAWAYFVAVLPVFWMFYWVEKKILDISGTVRFYAVLYSKLVVTSVVFWGIASLYGRFVTNITGIIIAGPLSVLLYYVLYKLFGFFEQEDWVVYKGFLKTTFGKFTFKKNETV